MKIKLQLVYQSFIMISRYALAGLILQCLAITLLSAKDVDAQSLYQVPVSLESKEAQLGEIFQLIESQTTYNFTFNPAKVNLTHKLNLTGEEKNLGEILETISRLTSLRFKKYNNIIAVRRISNPAVPAIKSQDAGIITGRISDAVTNEPLPGATIRITGTTLGTSSDLNGEFQLRVPAGKVSLEISYIGFETTTQEVEVPANGSLQVNVTLKSSVQQLESVTVTGVLEGQQRALNQQKSADNIKNIISADQIGRFPDPNVAEALQRVPAVNIERDQGEGRYVLVRGLAPQFTNISINGEQIPSPEAGVRYVALDAIPADQLASIEVSKSLTPDMDGDAIGGSVNLITRTAQSENTSISATAVGGYNQIVGRSNLQGSLEIGKRFLDNKLGIMLNSSYYESDRGSDNWERDDEEMELRDYELVRTRLGLSSTIDFKFNDLNEIYFRSIYNRFTDREQRRRYVLVPNADNSPFENNEIERLTKDRLEKQIVSSYNFGGKHNFDKFKLDYEVAYAEGIQDTPYDIEIASVGEFDELAIDFDTNPDYPTFTVNGLPNSDRNNDYLNNENYEFDEFVSGTTYAYDVNKTAKFNITIPYTAGGNQGTIKFGSKIRNKIKRYDIIENVYSWEGGDVTFPGFDEGDYTLEKFSGGPSGSILDGRYLIEPNVLPSKVIEHFNANRSGYELDVDGKLATEAVESYRATEDVFAVYAMTKLETEKLRFIGGLRYENTTVKYRSKEVYYDFEGELDEIVPVSGGTDYGFLLPQVQLRYAVNNSTNLRFAATRSYSRPNFEDIIPSQEIDLNGREGSIGNPALKPVSAYNFDFLAEKYYGTVGILSAGIFYKQLDNFIFQRRFETENYNGRDFGTEIQLSQAQNGESAGLFGFEIAYQQQLSFLPGFLSGLTTYANFTYTLSNAKIQSRESDGTEEIRLPGQAKNVGNLSLGYNKGKFNVRVSANFNGEYISEIGDDKDEDLYVANRVQVDFNATYTISKKIRIFSEFLNITNQPFEVYQGTEDRKIQREFYSWWMRAGLKFDF